MSPNSESPVREHGKLLGSNDHLLSVPRSLIQVDYHLYTLWLFVYSDLKTMVIPSTMFALANGLALNLSKTPSTQTVSMRELILRVPLALFWAWINTLAFNIGNQRQAKSIEEDKHNKPWRPLPASRLTVTQAQIAGLLVYPVAWVTSLAVGGGIYQSLLLFVLGYTYNDLGGGDINFVTRNFLNACGFTSFASGAFDVLLNSPTASKDNSMLSWLATIAAIVFTTVHTQDMYDQQGDSAIGRRTLPLVVGDHFARWTIAVAVLTWSWVCPTLWAGNWFMYTSTMSTGSWIAVRTMTQTSVKQDRTTFVIYNGWLVTNYLLPLIGSVTARSLD